MLSVSPKGKPHERWPCSTAMELPKWVRDGFADAAPEDAHGAAVRQAGHLRLISVRVPAADELPALAFQRQTASAYVTIRRQLETSGPWHPIRIWNFIPDLHRSVSDGMDRYMVFNAGRYAAYYDWYAGESGFASSIATATGVGHDGPDLMIHVLAADRPGTPIENPRQVESYHYSHRYGPMPPCFARATIAPPDAGDSLGLLVGGTSSVRGEASVGSGDADGQTGETLENLAHLIRAARCVHAGEAIDTTGIDIGAELKRFESLRVYYMSAESLPRICERLAPHVDHLGADCVDLVRAEICRRELLVEIEGVASLAD